MTPRSASVGTMRSMPMSATCTRGTVVVSRPLPSFVQMQRLPVSATPKLPPEIPMSALRKPARRRRLANAVICGTSATSSSVACELLLEEPRHIAAALVDDRRHDVRRMVAVDLDDELAEIGLEDVDAGAGERGVELDLLADHRLRFHGGLRAVLPRDVGDDRDGVVRRLGPVHVAAAGADGVIESREVVVEPRDRVRAYRARVIADAIGVLEGARCRRRGSRPAAWWRASSPRASPGPSARDRRACRRSPAPLSFVRSSRFVLRPRPSSASSSGQVLYLHGAAAPMKPAADVQQAADVGRDHRVRPRSLRCWRSFGRGGCLKCRPSSARRARRSRSRSRPRATDRPPRCGCRRTSARGWRLSPSPRRPWQAG